MNLKTTKLLFALVAAIFISCLPLSACAATSDKFTIEEQTQVMVPTPHLFDSNQSFDVDFTNDVAYSFPLPVGKATKQANNSVRITSVKGDVVKAMFDGVVRLSRKSGSYGNVVVVRHSNGLETVYANNVQNLVKVGASVKAGQTIALIGTKNGSCYCDFSIMVNGGRMNPELVVDLKNHHLHKHVLTCRKHGSYVDVFVQYASRKKMEADEKNVQQTNKNKEPSVKSSESSSSKNKESSALKKEPSSKTKDSSARKNESSVKAKEQSEDVFTNLDPDEAKEITSNTFKLNLAHLEKERWAYPLPGAHVISPYGGKRNHAGVDIKTHPNDTIYASFDGVVTRSSPYFGYGNCIVIRHAYGFETLYSHQSKNFTKVGQHVKAGQAIGLTGRTGRATTEHLHFEVHYSNRRINPNVIFNHSSHGLQPSTLTLTKGGGIKSTKN